MTSASVRHSTIITIQFLEAESTKDYQLHGPQPKSRELAACFPHWLLSNAKVPIVSTRIPRLAILLLIHWT